LRVSGRRVIVAIAAVVASASARAADVAVPEPRTRIDRDLATLSAREVLLSEQAATARAAARWRAAALYRLAVGAGSLAPATRARAIDVGARALARALAEERVLAQEGARTRAERLALAAGEAAEPAVGASPRFVAPTAGAVLARFGVAPDRSTGLLVSRPGVRLAASPGQDVFAPAAGVVVSTAVDEEGGAVMLDHGAGWTTIVGGLGRVAVVMGQRVATGAPLGAVADGRRDVAFEVWRGLRPVDPQLLLRRTGSSGRNGALAAPAALP
jgi:murein hydrolase activator